MGSGGKSTANTAAYDVAWLSNTYLALNHRRMELDRRIIALPDIDPERENLWQQLETVVTELCRLVTTLATTPCKRAADLRAKATVLGMLLTQAGDLAALDADTADLALSLANEVASLA